MFTGVLFYSSRPPRDTLQK